MGRAEGAGLGGAEGGPPLPVPPCSTCSAACVCDGRPACFRNAILRKQRGSERLSYLVSLIDLMAMCAEVRPHGHTALDHALRNTALK